MSPENNINKLSVIMHALNEEFNIAAAISDTLAALDCFKIDSEIIVVNDGSSDSTQVLIEQKIIENPGRISFIKHEKPKGIGASFWEGVDKASADAVVMIPGDNENDSREILRYYWLLDHVDIIVPFAFNKEIRPFLRNLFSSIFTFIIDITFAVNFHYTNGTIIYRKSILRDLNLRLNGFFFQADILIRLVKKGYLFAEVPQLLQKRELGKSKAVNLSSFLKVSKNYLTLIWEIYFLKKHKKININAHKDSMTAQKLEKECG